MEKPGPPYALRQRSASAYPRKHKPPHWFRACRRTDSRLGPGELIISAVSVTISMASLGHGYRRTITWQHLPPRDRAPFRGFRPVLTREIFAEKPSEKSLQLSQLQLGVLRAV